MRKRVPRLVFWPIVITILVGVGVAVVERRPLMDWFSLRNYHPSTAVQQLASDTTMDDYARRIFYVNHPQIDDKSQFSKVCSTEGEQTIVLGCYHSDQQGIYVLGVNDPRLNGVEEVTAAHEMLHAAYDRLSTKDKNYIDGLLTDYYEHDLHDSRILDTMAAYKKSEPGQLVNEMHSVFGTEIGSLPEPLENYYKRYFTNRKTITQFAAQYQEAFTSRQAQIKQYDTQLSAIKTQVTNAEALLADQLTSINNAKAQLDAYRAAQDTAAYSAAVPAYNNSIGSYNVEAYNIRNLISQYNLIVSQRNAIALEEQQLTTAIDSNVTSISK